MGFRLFFGAASAASPPSVTISSVSSATPRVGATLVITGTNFGALQGTQSVEIGGTTCTPLAWADGEISVVVALGTNLYDEALTVEIRDGGVLVSNSYAGITGLLPPSGWDHGTVGTPEPDASLRLTGTADAIAGDQYHWDTKGGLVVVNDDLTWVAAQSVKRFAAGFGTAADGYGPSALQILRSSGNQNALVRSVQTLLRRFML